MDRLIIFTRYPEVGKVKTRLIPTLGAEGAAECHRRMAEYVVNRLRSLGDGRRASIEIRYDGPDEEQMRSWLGSDLIYRSQGGGDLGERMARAFREAFADGAGAVVLVGTDCPEITGAIVEKAFSEIRRHEVVFGPSQDGGYYLVGLRRDVPGLFSHMPWGTGEVLDRSLAVAQVVRASVGLVDRMRDVDRPEDLSIWEKASVTERISVVIPTLNERENIAQAVESARRGVNVEIIVVDALSSDGTAEMARSLGVKVISVPPGRAEQQNRGAAEATGGILLFLHGDCTLPEGFDRDIRRALARPGVVAGAFHLKIDMDHWGVRVIEWLGNWRSRRMGLSYGDQGIFLRSDLFRAVSGFPDMTIMEDFELMKRLRRRGRITTISTSVTTSGRRWRAMGILRTTLINQVIILGYFLGASPSRMARWYDRESGLS